MKKKLTVLMAAAECRGIAKVGGLADVAFDLSLRLANLGHRVLVLLPFYSDLATKLEAQTEPVLDFLVRFEGKSAGARLHKTKTEGLEVYLIEASVFQGELGSVYVDSGRRGKGPFEDDARRFAFFSASVWELVKHHGPFSSTDVVHCHDWHTGLVPLLIELDGQSTRYPSLFTIHNLDYQGIRPFDEHYAPGASWSQWFPERWESLQASPFKALITDPVSHNCFNPMRCGIRMAGAVNTVSPSYAKEITLRDDSESNFLGGRGLEKDLGIRKAEGRLSGILNGLDYEGFDPSKLSPPFSRDDKDLLARRKAHRDSLWKDLPSTIEAMIQKHGPKFGNARRVQEHLEVFLKAGKKLPLTVCVTRAVSQKLGLFSEDLASGVPVSKSFLGLGSALLVIGTGELEGRLEPLNDEPTALFLQCFDAEFANRLYAAGDLFLMPSDFEPCGISQLISMRFGCLPLVHDRGGLHDTVQHGITGFSFQATSRELAKEAFLRSAKDAIKSLKGEGHETMVRQAMAERFEWTGSVKEYVSLYQSLTGHG